MDQDIKKPQPKRPEFIKPRLHSEASKTSAAHFSDVHSPPQNSSNLIDQSTDQTAASRPQPAGSKPDERNPTNADAPQAPANKPPKARKNKWPVLLAICALLILSSLAIYIGVKQNSSDDKNPNNDSSSQAQENKNIEDVLNEINSLEQNPEPPAENLSDQSLAL